MVRHESWVSVSFGREAIDTSIVVQIIEGGGGVVDWAGADGEFRIGEESGETEDGIALVEFYSGVECARVVLSVVIAQSRTDVEGPKRFGREGKRVDFGESNNTRACACFKETSVVVRGVAIWKESGNVGPDEVRSVRSAERDAFKLDGTESVDDGGDKEREGLWVGIRALTEEGFIGRADASGLVVEDTEEREHCFVGNTGGDESDSGDIIHVGGGRGTESTVVGNDQGVDDVGEHRHDNSGVELVREQRPKRVVGVGHDFEVRHKASSELGRMIAAHGNIGARSGVGAQGVGLRGGRARSGVVVGGHCGYNE